MKSFVFALLVYLVATFSFAQETNLSFSVSDVTEQRLQGIVKRTVSTSQIRMLLSSSGSRYMKTDERTYDEKGNRLLKELKKDGKVTKRVESYYDEDGCYIAETTEDFRKGTTEEWTVTIVADERKIIKRDTKTGDVQTVVYTPAGYELSVERVTKDGDLVSFSEFKRLPSNKEYEVVFFDTQKNPSNTFTLEWNADGTQSGAQICYHDKGMLFVETYKYLETDSHGNWIKRTKHTVLVQNGQERDWSEETTTREIEYY